mgnify:CR=1 FL=1|jgi:uncharacterized membrane protein
MIPFIFIAILLLILDSFYISFIGNYFYEMIKKIQNKAVKIKYVPVILCYILLILTFYFFIYREKKSLFESFLLGFFIYGIYELTNYATIDKWDYKFVIVDSIWGGLLFLITNFILKKIDGN